MKKKLFISFAFASAMLLSACNMLPSINPGDSSSNKPSSSTQPTSNNSQSSVSSNVPSSSAPQAELYYSVPFGNGVADGGEKWTKGKTYSWTFANCAAQSNVTFAIGAQMSSSAHEGRTLFTNSEGADSSDSFESNSANDGTPRITVKVNDVQQQLVTSTYGEAGLTNTELNYFKVTQPFSISAGNVTVTLTTHASAGYRLIIGGEARLYYPNNGGGGSTSSSSSSNPGTSSSTGGQSIPATSGAFAFNETELNTPQEIHTQNQLAYLNYDQPYYQITGSVLDGFDAKGNKNVSTPNPVTVNWGYGVPNGKTLSNYQFIFGQKSDLSDGYTINTSTTPKATFYNSFLGDNYFKVVANFSDGTKQESDIKVFKVTTQAPRSLYVGNMPNCRDMGGRTTYAGGKIKQGLIYRTSGSKFDNSTPSNDEAKDVLLNQLKVKTEINVANSTSNNVNLSGTKVENCYMAYGAVPYSNLARNSVRIRQVFDILAEENNYPVFYHCRIGTDRTGITGVMIGGLLGIQFNEIIQDYGYSNFAPIDNQRYPGKTPDNNGDDIKKYIDEILALPGANFQEQTYLALRMIGVPAAKLDKIINFMTEGNKATIPSTAKIGEDDGLTSSANKTTKTDYKSPASYYAVSANGTVSYTATTTAGKKDIIVYLGYTGSVSTSTSTKLSASLELKIDGVAQTISNTKSLWQAGFGSTQQDSRIGYMFNILGNYDLTAAEHTILITVKSGTFNIASITIADHPAA